MLFDKNSHLELIYFAYHEVCSVLTVFSYYYGGLLTERKKRSLFSFLLPTTYSSSQVEKLYVPDWEKKGLLFCAKFRFSLVFLFCYK
jgi:hypothetical protein